jgi:hypothetical protein
MPVETGLNEMSAFMLRIVPEPQREGKNGRPAPWGWYHGRLTSPAIVSLIIGTLFSHSVPCLSS